MTLGNFPKEASFPQLFNDAFTMQLPSQVTVYPELNTFAQDTSGKTVAGELDFYIAGHLHWAVELLRNGDTINEHVQRFDPNSGKHRSASCTTEDLMGVNKGNPCTNVVLSTFPQTLSWWKTKCKSALFWRRSYKID